MIFCPTCANMLTLAKSNQDDYRFTCASCPYEYPMRGKQYVETNYLTRKQADDVLGGEDSWKNVDSIEATCPKCDHRRAFYMQIQIRSADEPSTTFYRCTRPECAHQWKEN
ncbi:putative Rpc11-DNA-directed RNA polymerase III subunit C11 [Cystobasidium minutum MCA 4210]|uniref:putative Rpc11-DNA-directed RNA polymerase III subunit C11 n=1 Tax=Cystobasidium minutum MCA 4210 TaxID=1397322 RepID=UPI0034CD7EAB|eukprot:jgi/Rhomi1/63345/CE63344_149